MYNKLLVNLPVCSTRVAHLQVYDTCVVQVQMYDMCVLHTSRCYDTSVILASRILKNITE